MGKSVWRQWQISENPKTDLVSKHRSIPHFSQQSLIWQLAGF